MRAISFFMEEKVVRKKTAKPRVRKASVKKIPEAVPVREPELTTVARKAPTRFSSSVPTRKNKKLKSLGIAFFLCSCAFGVSALIGYTDKGQLDVANTISERRENASEEEKKTLDAISVRSAEGNNPNGGLVGMGQQTPEPAPVAEAVASTSTSTASSSPAASVTSAATTSPSENTPTKTDESSATTTDQAVTTQ
jgi:hypothetical protein